MFLSLSFATLLLSLTVPELAPSNVVAEKKSSTSIRVTWSTLGSPSFWNGMALGYEVHSRLKSAGSLVWSSVLVNDANTTISIVSGLLKYRMYEFKVAARTSKGKGPFGDIIEERTMEDGAYCYVACAISVYPLKLFLVCVDYINLCRLHYASRKKRG